LSQRFPPIPHAADAFLISILGPVIPHRPDIMSHL